MKTLIESAAAAKAASTVVAQLTTGQKNAALLAIAQDLRAGREEVLAANARDLARAAEAGMPASLQDRLRLTPARVEDCLLYTSQHHHPHQEEPGVHHRRRRADQRGDPHPAGRARDGDVYKRQGHLDARVGGQVGDEALVEHVACLLYTSRCV